MPTAYEISAQVQGHSPETRVRTPGGAAIVSSMPPEAGESAAHPSPMELLLASIAACKTMTMQAYARRKGWKLERADIGAKLRRAATPGDADSIAVAITLQGDLDAEQRNRLVEIAGRCPVSKLVAAGVRIEDELE